MLNLNTMNIFMIITSLSAIFLTLCSLTSANMIILWTILGFTFLINQSIMGPLTSNNSNIFYFIIQEFSSLLLITSIYYNWPMLILLSLCIKSGLPPCHYYMLKAMITVPLDKFILLLTTQKMIYIMVLLPFMVHQLILFLLMGLIMIITQMYHITNLKTLIFLNSSMTINLMLMFILNNFNYTIYLLFIYFLLNYIVLPASYLFHNKTAYFLMILWVFNYPPTLVLMMKLMMLTHGVCFFIILIIFMLYPLSWPPMIEAMFTTLTFCKTYHYAYVSFLLPLMFFMLNILMLF